MTMTKEILSLSSLSGCHDALLEIADMLSNKGETGMEKLVSVIAETMHTEIETLTQCFAEEAQP